LVARNALNSASNYVSNIPSAVSNFVSNIPTAASNLATAFQQSPFQTTRDVLEALTSNGPGGFVAGVGALGTAVRIESIAAKGAGEASSLANSALLKMQLRAEEIAGARLPAEVSGYSRHGLNQAISRDGVGVAPGAILDAFNNPLAITGQSGGRFMMTGKDAVVIVNDQGKVITTWATNAAGVR
tara:strand:- start:1664 stop:2218 length:555 start_codon:yes stop_codon:yes gene_type:complete